MSLNTIRFDTAAIALLYKNSLVDMDAKRQKPSSQISESGEFKFLGENKKKTLIVVRYPGAVHIPDKPLSFLIKLLSACNLTLEDVAILNFQNHQPEQFNLIFDHFEPRAVLLFDVKPTAFGMPMNFPEYQVQTYKNALFVSCPALEIIEPEKNLKGKLWASLKKIYHL